MPPMKITLLAVSMLAGLAVAVPADAKTVKVPKTGTAYTVDVPADWTVEAHDTGVTVESEDQEVTMIFEVAKSKEDMDEIIESSVAWLDEEGVEIDKKSEKKGATKFGARSWDYIHWAGNNEEWGAATVGFLFADLGNGSVGVTTYWVTAKGFKEREGDIGAVLTSVKPTP
jgi:hypothetical protein